MIKKHRWIGFLLALILFTNPGFGWIGTDEEVSGRGGEEPAAMLIEGTDIYLAFREPARIVRYDLEWVEVDSMDLPENAVPHEMIVAGDFLWILDEERDLIIQADLQTLETVQLIGEELPVELIAIFEVNGQVLAMDENGYVYICDEVLSISRRLTGMSIYESVVFDGYLTYIGGRFQDGNSGVLVKTQEDVLVDEWKLCDDPAAPAKKGAVEKVRLLPDGFMYVVYRDIGVAKYDGDGNQYNRIYQEAGAERIFMDIAYNREKDTYYLTDLNAGIFTLAWPDEEIIYAEIEEESDSDSDSGSVDDWGAFFNWDEWDDIFAWLDWYETEGWKVYECEEIKGEARIKVRTWNGLTTAKMREGQLFGFYQSDDVSVHIWVHARNSEALKLKLHLSDLIQAQEKGFEILKLDWNQAAYEFPLFRWNLQMKDLEVYESQYVEILVDSEGVRHEVCYVERLDEKTKVVRREELLYMD